MADPFRATRANTAQAISAGQVNHLPIVSHFARRLGLVEIVNRLVTTQMEVEPGLIVLGLVLDTLSGRSPLYHLHTAFEDCDRAVLFARELPAQYCSDDNVGRMLDRLYEVGAQRIFCALSVAALERFPVSTHHAHFDPTSVNLYGDYLAAQGEEAPFKIAHGYSKDKRPDLKQFVLSLLWGNKKGSEPSGSEVTSPSPRPLRTVQATFTVQGSSLEKAPRSTRWSTGMWLRRITGGAMQVGRRAPWCPVARDARQNSWRPADRRDWRRRVL